MLFCEAVAVAVQLSVVPNTLQPQRLQLSRLLCPPSPRVCSHSCPLSWWGHLTILSPVVPLWRWGSNKPWPAPPYEMKHNVLETYVQYLSACGSARTRKSAASRICHSEQQKSVLDNWIYLPLFVVKCWPHAIMIATVGRKYGHHYLSMSVLKALGPETSPSHTFFLLIPARFRWRNLWLEPHNSLWERAASLLVLSLSMA